MHKLILWALTSSALLAGCGGDDEPPAAGLPLPPASASRWATLEADNDGDGLADSITRFGYDALGRRINQTTWTGDRGIPIGEPVEVQTWVYDGASRVLVHRVEADGVVQTNSAVYGADGLLASTMLRSDSGPFSQLTTYTWQDRRLVEAKPEYSEPQRLSYDAEGRVERIETRGGDGAPAGEVSYVETYNWRTDGQLATAAFDSSWVGNLRQYDLKYDVDGRHNRTYKTDDGIEDEMSRHFHDAEGRLERVEADNRPGSFDEADFVADVVYRIRWENGLCQPAFLLGLPPVFDRNITGEARADGAMLGCAN